MHPYRLFPSILKIQVYSRGVTYMSSVAARLSLIYTKEWPALTCTLAFCNPGRAIPRRTLVQSGPIPECAVKRRLGGQTFAAESSDMSLGKQLEACV